MHYAVVCARRESANVSRQRLWLLATEHDHQQAPDKTEILEEFPQLLPPLALALGGEVVVGPEWMVQHGGRDAEGRKDRRRRAGVAPGQDTDRRDRLHRDRSDQQRRATRQRS